MYHCLLRCPTTLEAIRLFKEVAGKAVCLCHRTQQCCFSEVAAGWCLYCTVIAIHAVVPAADVIC